MSTGITGTTSPTEPLGGFGIDLRTLQPGYSILMVRNDEPGRRWTLNIQSLPEPAVTLSGVDPSADEMKRALQYLPVPIWMIDLCMVLAAVATRVER
jgi:hypothetical protein